MGTHAVVIGGSLAGLCAARVLADRFDRVTVLDRDAHPTGTFERAGVGQGWHPHALLARGRQELNRLFPGFESGMLAGGALDLDFGLAFAALRAAGWQPREPGGIPALFASRLLLESVVRDLVSRLRNVRLVERTEVRALIAASGSPLRIAGVQTRGRDGGRGELAADLVVDASGRSSRAPGWLRRLGIEPPPDSVVDSFCGYSTRWYRLPERWPWWWRGIWIDAHPPAHPDAGVLFPVEYGRAIVTLVGVARRYPPPDEAGFLSWLAGLRSPILAQAVRCAEPISAIYCHRAMANRFRHYERWGARVAGFLAVGDAVCAFNPIYGQGMTCAAVAAGILAQVLDAVGPTGPELPERFFAAQAPFLTDVWGMATGADFRIPETVGQRPALLSLVTAYMDAVFAASMEDAVVRREIVEVINLLKTPAALFALPVIVRAAMSTARRLTRDLIRTPPPVPATPAG